MDRFSVVVVTGVCYLQRVTDTGMVIVDTTTGGGGGEDMLYMVHVYIIVVFICTGICIF